MRLHISSEKRRLREIASFADLAGADMARRFTPAVVDQIQDVLRTDLQSTDERLRKWRARRAWRKRWRARTLQRDGASGPCISAHSNCTKFIERLIELQRSVFRQVGDSIAWLAFGGEPDRIVPLFSRERVHVATTAGVGLAGVAIVSHALNASDEFFAIENDLTRCVGIGDITVFRRIHDGSYPCILELKSHGKFEIGSEISVGITTTVGPGEPDRSLQMDLLSVLDASAVPETKFRSVANRDRSALTSQEGELLKRTQRLARALGRPVHRLGRSQGHLWNAIENVLDSALRTGRSFDLAEKGVVYCGLRESESVTSPTEDQMLKLGEAVIEQGLVSAGSWMQTSTDLLSDPRLAPIAVPIPLWPIKSHLRRELLSGDLVLVGLADQGVWRNVFATRGMTLEETEDRWVIRRGDQSAVIGKLEIAKLRIGVLLNGISPTDIASRLADGMTS